MEDWEEASETYAKRFPKAIERKLRETSSLRLLCLTFEPSTSQIQIYSGLVRVLISDCRILWLPTILLTG
jgi:hypothetical protein